MAVMMAVNDVLEVRFVSYLQNQIGINVVNYVVITSNGTGQSLQGAADRMNTLMAPLYKPLLANAAKYRGAGVRRKRPFGPSIEYFNTSLDGIGTVTGSPLPKQVSGVLTKVSEIAGRRARGRLFVPFPGSFDNDVDSTPVTSYLTRLLNLANGLLGPIVVGVTPNDVTLANVIDSRAAGLWVSVNTYVARDRWGTQRRRGDYGKTNSLPW